MQLVRMQSQNNEFAIGIAVMETELLILAGIGAFVVWLLYVVWQYTAMQSGKSIAEQNQFIFGKFHRVKNQRFTFIVVPRAGSPRGLLVVVAITMLAAFGAKFLGLID